MFEEETFNADELVSGDVSIASIAITQDHKVETTAISLGSPSVPNLQLVQTHGFTTSNTITGAPTIPILLYDAALGRIVDEADSSVGQAELETSAPNSATVSLTGANKVDIAA